MKENYFAEELESNFFNTAFRITGNTWINITFSNLVYTLVSVFFVVVLFFGILGDNVFKLFSGDQMQNSQLLQEIAQDNFSNFLTPSFIGSGILFIAIMMLVVSWMQYFSFIATSDYIVKQDRNFMNILMKSLTAGVFRMLGIFIVMYFLFAIMFGIATITVSVSGILAFLLFLAIIVFAYRFILVLPAFVLGKNSISESIQFSFEHVSWGKAFKYFGITILAFLIMMVAGIILSLFGLLLNMIPYAGIAIQYIFQILMGGFFTAFGAAIFIGLYYRATGELKNIDQDNNDDDLIIESLQE